jgi:predicted peroxiredoxin
MRAVSKGLFHKNKGARKISRLAKRVKTMQPVATANIRHFSAKLTHRTAPSSRDQSRRNQGADVIEMGAAMAVYESVTIKRSLEEIIDIFQEQGIEMTMDMAADFKRDYEQSLLDQVNAPGYRAADPFYKSLPKS